MGRPSRKPCARSQPASRSTASCAGVSTPSAVTCSPRPSPERDRAAEHGVRPGVLVRRGHQGAVHLQRVEGVAAQVGQAGVAGAEIVERQTHAQATQRLQGDLYADTVLDQQPLRDLELQATGRQPRARQHGRDQGGNVVAVELRRRQVHRDCHILWPGSGSAAGLLQHGCSQPHDQARALRQGDEHVGRDHAVLRVGPTRQGLEAVKVTGGDLVDRLELHRQPACFDRAREVAFKGAPLSRGGLHRRLERHHAPATFRLGTIQREIDPAQQLLRGAAVLRPQHQADAGPHALRPARHEGIGRKPGRDGCSGTDALHLVGMEQHQNELVAANARQEVVRSEAPPQPRRYLPQQRIPAGVAQLVVDRLEAVEIQAEQTARRVRRVFQAVEQAGPVGGTGQGVVTRQVEGVLLRPAQVVHVRGGAEPVRGTSLRVAQRHGAGLEPAPGAVRPAQPVLDLQPPAGGGSVPGSLRVRLVLGMHHLEPALAVAHHLRLAGEGHPLRAGPVPLTVVQGAPHQLRDHLRQDLEWSRHVGGDGSVRPRLQVPVGWRPQSGVPGVPISRGRTMPDAVEGVHAHRFTPAPRVRRAATG